MNISVVSEMCAGCLVVITDHGPRAEVARVLRHELVVDSGEGVWKVWKESSRKKRKNGDG